MEEVMSDSELQELSFRFYPPKRCHRVPPPVLWFLADRTAYTLSDELSKAYMEDDLRLSLE